MDTSTTTITHSKWSNELFCGLHFKYKKNKMIYRFFKVGQPTVLPPQMIPTSQMQV
jgi:hypothetical protein